MKILIDIFMVVAAVSLIVGIISRALLAPVLSIGLEARAFMGFSMVCLLFAITLGMRMMVRK